MSDNFVSKDLFQESIKNIHGKLDHINDIQERFIDKLDQMIDGQSSISEKLIKLSLSESYQHDKISELENKIKELFIEAENRDKIIDQFQSDKKWIGMIFASGWTLTLTIVHLYLKYKLG
jgi:hypothetical protein